MFGKPPCKKHVVLAGLVAVALLLGMAGTAIRTNTAQAKPTGVLTFSPNVCIALMRVIEGDCSGNGSYTAGECDAICAAGLSTPGGLNALARVLGAGVSPAVGAVETWNQCGNGVDDDVDTIVDDGCAIGYNDPALFQDLNDLSGAQLGENSVANPALTDGKLWVLTFVSNDGALTLEADEGVWLSNSASNTNCGVILDEDCDNDGVKGDKIVVDLLLGNGVADLGDAQLVATQGGVDVIYDYVVVGAPPGDITVSADPASMACDGLTSSIITASLTDGDGSPVADGTPVHFSVQGRAIVDPVNALTIGGTASTALIGLSGVTVTLPVSALSGDLEGSVDVECVAPPPLPIGDVNCSGTVTMLDAMLVAQYVVGLIPEFPCNVSPPPLPTPTP